MGDIGKYFDASIFSAGSALDGICPPGDGAARRRVLGRRRARRATAWRSSVRGSRAHGGVRTGSEETLGGRDLCESLKKLRSRSSLNIDRLTES